VNRPRPYLAAFIFALVLSGIYTINMSLFDLALVLSAGLFGYVMRYLGFPFLPAVLGVVLGGLIESNYRRSLVLSGGDLGILLEDPIAVTLLSLSALMVSGALVREYLTKWTRKRAA
jgi:putative tricarboxylic transport membrane protein